MLDQLRRLFEGEAEAPAAAASDRHKLAAAALLVTAGAMDDTLDEAERQHIATLLEERFDMDHEAASTLLREAEDLARRSVDFYGFTSAIKDGFDPDERIGIIEMVWEVVYVDGVLHDHEASLMRRLAGLLGVTDRDSGAARVRVRERLGL